MLAYGGPNWKIVDSNKSEHKFGDIIVSHESLLKWSDSELGTLGIKKVKMQEIPSGKRIASYSIANNAGVPVQVCQFEDIPAPKLTTYKTDIWRRCTDAEADALDAELSKSKSKLRRIFDAAQIIEHDSPEFVYLRAGVEKALLGVARADEILAPSNV